MKILNILKQIINSVTLSLISILLFGCGQHTKDNKKEVMKNEVIKNYTPEKQKVLDAILRLHDGMRKKDGGLAVSAWAKNAAAYTISIDSLGQVTKMLDNPVDSGRLERIQKWLDETNDDLDEEIFDVEIFIDSDLAIAWVPYNFHRNKKFSHSGTNAFTLMKFKDTWRIVSVVDTRYFGKKIHE